MRYQEILSEITAYHGSTTGHPAFDVKHTGYNSHTFGTYKSTRNGIFFTTNPKVAAIYGDVKTYELNITRTVDLDNDPNIIFNFIEYIRNHDDTLLYDVKGIILGNHPTWLLFEEEVGEAFVKYLKELGYDSATFNEEIPDNNGNKLESKTIVVFNPSKVIKDDQPELNLWERANTRFRKINEKISPSRLEKYVNENNIRMGFELEFIVPGYDISHYREYEEIVVELEELSIKEIKNRLYSDATRAFTVSDRLNYAFRQWYSQKEKIFIDQHYNHLLDGKVTYEELERQAKDKFTEQDWINEVGLKNILEENVEFLFTVKEIDVRDNSITLRIGHEVTDNDEHNRRKDIGKKIESLLNVDLVVLKRYHSQDKSINKWYLEPDSSIQPNDPSVEAGVELVTPVFKSVEIGLLQLKRCFEMINEIGYTNSSTGLHVNMSFADDRVVDPLKLVVLLGEKYVAKVFGRDVNETAKQQLDVLLNALAYNDELYNHVKSALNNNDMEELSDILTPLLKDKYRSVNIKNDILEFRVIGNTEYQARFNKVKEAILRFVYAMRVASSKEMMKTNYLKKLAKLLVDSKNWSNLKQNSDNYKELEYFNISNLQIQEPDRFYNDVKKLLHSLYGVKSVGVEVRKVIFKRIFTDLLFMYLDKNKITLTATQLKILYLLAKHARFDKKELNRWTRDLRDQGQLHPLTILSDNVIDSIIEILRLK